MRAVLAVGYLSLSAAVLVAYANPADGYEASIYGSTPLLYWLLALVALGAAFAVSFYAPKGYVSVGGLCLAGGTVFSVAALPVIRGYAFYGRGDGLTHLGWTRDVASGLLSPFSLFYPGIHSFATMTAETVGWSLPRGMLLVVLAFFLVYVVFVPLSVMSITPHRGATVLAVFGALLVLPVNQISTHYMSPHSFTDALLLTPLALYLGVNYLTSSERGPLVSFSAVGGLLALVSVGTVLYHPMQAANVFVLFGAVLTSQLVARRFRPGHPVAATRTFAPQTGLLGLAFVLWVAGRGRFQKAIEVVGRSLTNYFLRGEAQQGVVAQRTGSLVAIGSGITEVFLKLFLVGAIYAGIAGLLMLASLTGQLDDVAPDTDALVKHLTAGLALLLPYSFLFFFGSASDLFFRNFGFVMAIVTVLGTVALHRYVTGVSKVLSTGPTRVLTIVALAVMLVLSLIVLFPSPYIYSANEHTSDQDFSGYATAFDHQAQGIEFYGLRQGPWRLRQGIDGVGGVGYDPNTNAVNNTTLRNLLSRSAGDRYVALSDYQISREVLAYEGLRYDVSTLRSIRRQPGVHRVQSNGDVRVYYVDTAA